MAIHLVCTKLKNSSKVGNLPKDDNGYYEITLGALNTYNNVGMFYVGGEKVESLIQNTIDNISNKINKGVLMGEWGHPSPRGFKSTAAYMSRLHCIDEQQTSHHIKSLRFEEAKDHKGNKYTKIIGQVKPSGRLGDRLEPMFQNKDQNVCFSIRSIADEGMINGVFIRRIKDFITFDYVTEGGIAVANKYDSPALESVDTVNLEVTPEDYAVLSRQVERDVKRCSGLESAGYALDPRQTNPETSLFKEGNEWNKVEIISPLSIYNL